MTQQRLYNPALLADEDLKKSFVVRYSELDQLLHLLHEQPLDSPLQHVLIVGQRGMGKTMLGLRLLLAVREDPTLSALWQPVPFFEESYGITDLAELWLTALQHLSAATGDNQWARRAGARRPHALVTDARDSERVAAQALADLIDFRTETQKRPILFIENLDEVFAQFRDPQDVARLRSILQERFDILLIGTANTVFEAITSREKPFYEFFRQVRLDGLSEEETSTILQRLESWTQNSQLVCDIETNPGRIEVIRRFTDGNPRLIALAARLITESPLGDARDDLERLIDEQTPYFKARIDSLPAQLRSIFHVLAAGWKPMLAREVAAETRLSSSQASAQLKKLTKLGYLEEIREQGKRLLRYQVRERFYNIYYLLRFTRDQRLRLQRLIDFITQMFGSEVVSSIAQATLARLRTTSGIGTDEWTTLEFLAPRLAESADQDSYREIFHEAFRLGQKQGVEVPTELLVHVQDATFEDPSALRSFIKVACRSLEKHPDNFMIWVHLARAYGHSQDWIQSAEALTKVIDLLPPEAPLYSLRGMAFVYAERNEEAEKDLLKAVEINPSLTSAWQNLGNLYYQMNRLEKAENAFSKAIEIVPDSAAAWCGLGEINARLNREQDALTAFTKATDFDPNFTRAWIGMGLAHILANRYEHSVKAFRTAVQLKGDDLQLRAIISLVLGIAGLIEKSQEYLTESHAHLTRAMDSEDPTALAIISFTLTKFHRDFSTAEELIQRAIASAPENLAVVYFATEVFSDLKKWPLALQQIAIGVEIGEHELLRGFTHVLVSAIAHGQGQQVLSLLEDSILGELQEPILHAVREELGLPLQSLPAEIMKAKDEVRERIASEREGSSAANENAPKSRPAKGS